MLHIDLSGFIYELIIVNAFQAMLLLQNASCFLHLLHGVSHGRNKHHQNQNKCAEIDHLVESDQGPAATVLQNACQAFWTTERFGLESSPKTKV